jgi:hypothetical protein
LCPAAFGGTVFLRDGPIRSLSSSPYGSGTRIWLVRALFLSIALHIGFFVFAYWKKMENFAFTDQARLAPPSFVAQRVTIDPKTLEQPEETRVKLPAAAPKPEELTIPSEKPEPKEIILKPSATEVQSPLLQEKPESKPINWEQMMKSDEISAGAADKQIGAIASTC